MKTDKVNLIYKLEGPAIDEGIDVFELAPILLSMGQLIDESNKVLYPGKEQLAVNVKPFEKGSFIVDIVLFAKSNFHELLRLANSNDVKRIKELLVWIGLITAPTGLSLVGLIKWLKGKPKRIEPTQSGDFRYYSDDNKYTTVGKEIHNLYQNCTIQKNIQNVYSRPFDKDGIEKIESYVKNDGEINVNTVFKQEAPYFRVFVSQESESVNEQVVENRSVIFLNPKRGSYGGEGGVFSFRKGNTKDETISATIKDALFNLKLKTGEIRLYANDLLKVRLLEKQKIIGQEVDSITYEIIEVLEYKKAPEQTDLPLSQS